MVYVHRLFSIGFLFLLLVSLRWPTAVAQAEYVLSTESATDDFGRFVAIDGDVAMVGAFKDDESGTDAGAVFVYRLNGDQWIEEQKLLLI